MDAQKHGLTSFQSSTHEELPLAEMPAYADLQRVHEVWSELTNKKGHFPAQLDPTSVPVSLLPYMMLLDVEADCLRVRLAGTRVCEEHGGEMRGRTTDDFFKPEDGKKVLAAGLRVAETGEPSLARKSYIAINGRRWSYVRMILPLSSDGVKRDRLFKLLDPATLEMTYQAEA